MTGFRALVMLVAIAVLMFVFLPILSITGLGDLNASNGYTPDPTAPSSGSPSATASPPPGGGAGGGQAITETSTKIAFQKTSYTIPAGQVTITYDNKDTGVSHNFHLFAGTNASGKSIGKTPIQLGPNTKTLKVNLKPGKYYFRCDVHPTQMTGTITVT